MMDDFGVWLPAWEPVQEGRIGGMNCQSGQNYQFVLIQALCYLYSVTDRTIQQPQLQTNPVCLWFSLRSASKPRYPFYPVSHPSVLYNVISILQSAGVGMVAVYQMPRFSVYVVLQADTVCLGMLRLAGRGNKPELSAKTTWDFSMLANYVSCKADRTWGIMGPYESLLSH